MRDALRDVADRAFSTPHRVSPVCHQGEEEEEEEEEGEGEVACVCRG